MKIGKRRKSIGEYEELLEWVRELVEESAGGSPIIVEGRRDLEALRALGIIGEIIIYKSPRQLIEKIRSVKTNHIVLLLDIDEEGYKKTIYVKKFLEGRVRNIDLTYWNRLKRFKRLGITTIQSLPHTLKRMEA
ncbi:MAG: hypothetical protein ABDH32_07880 [Candidatus Caldarchaeales archaeon]